MATIKMTAHTPQKKHIKPIYHPGRYYTLKEQDQNRQAWIQELRSGECKQHISHLVGPNDTRSAFGVAAQMLGCVKKQSGEGSFVFAGYTIAIPFEAEMALGLHGEEGDHEDEDEMSILDLNYFGKTFNEIADILEKPNSGYFIHPGNEDINTDN